MPMPILDRRGRWRLTLGGLLIAAVGPASGQEAVETPETAPSVPMYLVEIVVFENLAANARPEDPGRAPIPPPITVQAPGDAGLVFGDEPATLSPPPAGAALEEPTPSEQTAGEPLFFTPTKPTALGEAWLRLRRSSAYRPLVHEAWIQPGIEQGLSEPVALGGLSQARRVESGPALPAAASEPPRLDGDVTLYRNRFLHLELDLALGGDDGSAARLTGDRRIRSGEVHYFDAPGMGAIALVTPIELEPPAAVSATP